MALVDTYTRIQGLPAVDIPHVSPLRKGQVFSVAGSWRAPFYGNYEELRKLTLKNTGSVGTELDVYLDSEAATPGIEESPNNPITEATTKKVSDDSVISNPKLIIKHWRILSSSFVKFNPDRVRLGYFYLAPGQSIDVIKSDAWENTAPFFLKNTNSHLYIVDNLNQSAGIEVTGYWKESV